MFGPYNAMELALLLKGKQAPVVAVIGDVMLDEHMTVEVLGLSPEDDLAPKLKVLDTRWSAGGAANVACNLASLGAKVSLAGVVGDDDAALKLARILRECEVDARFSVRPGRPTTLKRRLVTVRGRHIARIDTESRNPLSDDDVTAMYKLLMFNSAPGLLVVSDYDKGVVTPGLMRAIPRPGPKLVVGPKKADFSVYGTVAVLAPNEKELRLATNSADREMPIDYLLVNAAGLASHVVVTLSEKGCAFTEGCGGPVQNVPTRAREIVDPAGCGDSFLAGLSYALALGWNLHEACVLGNICGGCAAGHIGVHVVNREEVFRELEVS